MATFIVKRRQSLAFSARSFSDIPAMKKKKKKSSADKLRSFTTHLVSLGGRPEIGAIRVFHRRQEWLQLMSILTFFFVLAKYFIH